MSEFNKQFAEQVKRAFGSYNADHLAEEGWNTLQQNRKSSKRLGFVFPRWAKAASVVILIGMGAILSYTFLKTEKTAHTLALEKEKLEHTKFHDAQRLEDTVARKATHDPVKPSLYKKAKEQPADFLAVTDEEKKTETKDFGLAEIDYNKITVVDSHEEAYKHTQKSSPEPEFLAAIEMPLSETTTLEPFTSPVTEVQPPRRTNLLAGFSGMMARVEDMVSKTPGVSVGLYANHRLSSSVSLRSGLALSKQTYGLESANSNMGFAYASRFTMDQSSAVTFKENHFDVVAMEIPINFVFNISERLGRTLYLSAGASTLVYLSQSFHGSFLSEYQTDSYNAETQEWTTLYHVGVETFEDDYGAFSHVDFFGLANISIGYTIPITEKSQLLIEPFVQLPIKPITGNNLQIFFGGLSVKVNLGH